MTVCSQCNRTDITGRGLCNLHYARAYRAGTLDQHELQRFKQWPKHCRTNCGRGAHTLGYCRGHYDRMRRHGSPYLGVTLPGDPIEPRFWVRVDVGHEGECWPWLGTQMGPYGLLSHDAERHSAHRLSYELQWGPIGSGMEIDHICRNQICVNPLHLQALTIAEHREKTWERDIPMKDLSCHDCSGPFQSLQPWAKYCGDCRHRRNIETGRRSYRKEDPEERRRKKRSYYLANAEKIKEKSRKRREARAAEKLSDQGLGQ